MRNFREKHWENILQSGNTIHRRESCQREKVAIFENSVIIKKASVVASYRLYSLLYTCGQATTRSYVCSFDHCHRVCNQGGARRRSRPRHKSARRRDSKPPVPIAARRKGGINSQRDVDRGDTQRCCGPPRRVQTLLYRSSRTVPGLMGGCEGIAAACYFGRYPRRKSSSNIIQRVEVSSRVSRRWAPTTLVQ